MRIKSIMLVALLSAFLVHSQTDAIQEYDADGCLWPFFSKDNGKSITSQTEFENAIRKDAGRDYCLKRLKPIDWSKYVLVGNLIRSGHCYRPPALDYFTEYAASSKTLYLNISYQEAARDATCRAASRYDLWLMIPRPSDNFKVVCHINPIDANRYTDSRVNLSRNTNFTDYIELKNGRIIRGKNVFMNYKKVGIETAKGYVDFPNELVKEYDRKNKRYYVYKNPFGSQYLDYRILNYGFARLLYDDKNLSTDIEQVHFLALGEEILPINDYHFSEDIWQKLNQCETFKAKYKNFKEKYVKQRTQVINKKQRYKWVEILNFYNENCTNRAALDNKIVSGKAMNNTIKAQFNKQIVEFFGYAENRKWSKILDATYPKLFDLQPRDKMLQALKQSYNGEHLKMYFSDFQYNDDAVFFKADHLQCAVADYSSKIQVKFLQKDDQSDTDFKVFLVDMQAKFSKQYPTSTLIKKGNMLHITGAKQLLGVYNESEENWTFVELTKSSSQLLSLLFEKKIANEIIEAAKLK